MLDLFIDTTQNICSLAISNEKKIIDCVSITTNKNITDIIVEEIGNLLKKNNFDINEVSSLYISVGPGSFTGIKVGIAIAKAWKLLKNIEVFTINSLLLQTQNGISIIDAKSKKFYFAIYENANEVVKPSIINEKDLEVQLKKYQKYNIYQNYKKTNIFKSFMNNKKLFNKIDSSSKIMPLYIKTPV